MNARWFTPLVLLSFAAFVFGAKAYISRASREKIEPPALGPAHRIYGEIPAAARRDTALSRVFKPRPRSLEPLPIMAMNRPVPEPIRPSPSKSAAQDTPVSDALKSAVAMAYPDPVVDPAPPIAEINPPPELKSDDQPPSEKATETANAVASVIEDDPGFTEPQLDGPAATTAPATTHDAASPEAETDPVPQKDANETQPLRWREALTAVAEQVDDAAVRLRSNYENGPAVVLARAFESLSAGKFESAVNDFDSALARNADLPQAWAGRGEALVGLNRFDEAAESYAKAVAERTCSVTTRYNYGVVLYRLSRNSDAGEQFHLVVARDPNHAEAHYNLATLAQRDGRLSEALEAWKAFTRLRPAVAGGWFNLGVVYMDYDRPGEAVSCFKRVTELDRNDADAHINLAMAYLASDQPAEALTALETAESRLPGDRVVLRYLADVHSQLAESGGPQAAMHLEKAASYRTRIAAAPTRASRPAMAGTSVESQP